MMQVMIAPNGATKSRADHPALPVTIAQTVDTARACFALGADALHLHVRDAAGGHALDPGLYREALAELARVVPGMEVQITTEAAGIYSPMDQLTLIRALRPKWASLALREAARDMDIAARIYATSNDQGTRLQHIIFDADDIALLTHWQGQDLIGPKPEVLLVLGRYSGNAPSDPAAIAPFVAALPPVDRWMLCAFGPAEHICLKTAAALGGDMRVGFENSTTRPDGTPWPDMATSLGALLNKMEHAA